MSSTRRTLLLTGLLGGAAIAGPLPAATAATFSDIASSPFRSDIEWLAKLGIAEGWPDGTYRPLQPITREAMAAFLHRLAGSPAVTVRERMFTDVSPGHPFAAEITWMKAQGLSWGWIDGTYRPRANIQRDAMAAFTRRLVEGRLAAAGVRFDPRKAAQFRDVRAGQPFADDIRWMRAAGIAAGWPDGTFRPASPVSREAMAAFFRRLEGLLQRA